MSDDQRRSASELVDFTAELGRLRGEIDSIDREILDRLNARAALVKEVGRLKAQTGRAPVYVASRERDLIQALVAQNRGPFPDAGIQPVFREIVSATRSLEETVRVAFLGPDGTFSHQAVVRQFGALVERLPAAHIREVFDLVERGRAHYGVVPVENTTEGAVTECFDALVESELVICGELQLEVRQNLLTNAGSLDRIKRVGSHPQPLAQCRGWLQRALPGIELVEMASTAAAARAAAEDATFAAIGSDVAADVYGLEVLEPSIEDRKGNRTRFFVIGRDRPAASGADLTSAVFTISKDQSGALFRLLEPFAAHGVNLTAVQSRPMKGKPWEYLFFVDMEGHVDDANVRAALDAAAGVAHSHKLLGSFPAAKTPESAARAVREGGGTA
ncbi:MAG: prephenate dehydratase [Myxococcota bacterium]